MFRCRKAIMLCLLLAISPLAAGPIGEILSIDRCKTRVGLARVVLEVTNVKVLADRIEAAYLVKIPMLPILNDRGLLRIDLPLPLDQIIRDRVPLSGQGNSTDGGIQHQIHAELLPDGKMEIRIENDHRVLDFSTLYRLR